MLGLTYELNGGRRPQVTREALRTKIMPEYTVPTRLPGIVDVVDVPASNGETVTVAIDENGDVVAAETKPNLLPLALAAGAAYFFLM